MQCSHGVWNPNPSRYWSHLHFQRRTRTRIPVAYRNREGFESESVQCEIICIVQCSHGVWNPNPSRYWSHLHFQRRTRTLIPVAYRNREGSESESVQCEIICIVQCSHGLWNPNPSRYRCHLHFQRRTRTLIPGRYRNRVQDPS